MIVALADFLTPLLLPKYQVDIDKRVYEVTGLNMLLVERPDVTAQQSRQPSRQPDQEGGVAAVPSPVQVTLPIAEEVREAYLEVKDVATQAVVTAIEILSPTNKRGEGRQKYLTKRQKVLRSQTHLVEIDLLLQGEPMLAAGSPDSQYRILVSRADQRPMADLYPFGLRDPIPAIPLPLGGEESEPVMDLQGLLADVYGRSGYGYFVDYEEASGLPLSEEEQAWIRKTIATASEQGNEG